MPKVHQLDKEFVVLNAAKDASVELADEGLYERIEQNYAGFAGCELIACHHFEQDWPSWEKHPEGDEVVVLLAGAVTFIVELPERQQEVSLTELGSYVIVPKNCWHTAKINKPTTMLFITPGEGTQVRS